MIRRKRRRAPEARRPPRGTPLRAARRGKDHRRGRREQDFGFECLRQTGRGKRITST